MASLLHMHISTVYWKSYPWASTWIFFSSLRFLTSYQTYQNLNSSFGFTVLSIPPQTLFCYLVSSVWVKSLKNKNLNNNTGLKEIVLISLWKGSISFAPWKALCTDASIYNDPTRAVYETYSDEESHWRGCSTWNRLFSQMSCSQMFSQMSSHMPVFHSASLVNT